jgi:hypothetical protein
MNAHLAADILGMNRVRWECQAMARALSLMSYLNTSEETARLNAARWAVRHWRAYAQECNARRDALFNIRRRNRG